MTPRSPESIAEILRDRLLRGIRAGALVPGARLPSARELVGEFNVDNRVILAAYRKLAADGLVEIRERGGVYVRQTEGGAAPTLPVRWFADMFAEGIARGFSASDLSECMRGLVETVRLRAIVISTTEDQVAGLARELREDFGINAEGLTAAALKGSGVHRAALRRSDVLIATTAHGEFAASLGEEVGKPSLVIDVRPDLIMGEWALLLRQPVWAVVATAEFGEMLRHFFSAVPGIENLRILVHRRDDLSQIPLGARTYVTHRVRESVDMTTIRGKILPPARTISTDSARDLFDFIVRANYRAQHAIRTATDEANRPA